MLTPLVPQHKPTALQIRQSLLSQDPQHQADAARLLGHTRPHIELPAITSTFALDQQGLQRLHLQAAKKLINAASNHVSSILALTPTAASNVIDQAIEAEAAATSWAMEHFVYSDLLDHLASLKDCIAWAQQQLSTASQADRRAA